MTLPVPKHPDILPPEDAHEVPLAVFNVLSNLLGVGEEETYAIEESSTTSLVRKLSDPATGVECWVSLQDTSGRSGPPSAMLGLWPRRPEEESGLVFAPKPYFYLRGGPRQTGTWMYGRGTQYTTDVVLDFGYFTKLQMTETSTQKFVPLFCDILNLIAAASSRVKKVSTWDGPEE